MSNENQKGTWIENTDPSKEITEGGFVFARSNEKGSISKYVNGEWKMLGRVAMYGDGVVGERMCVISLEKRHENDFNTSAVMGVTQGSDGQIVRTASGTLYRLDVAPAKNEVKQKSAVEGILAALGERFLRVFKR